MRHEAETYRVSVLKLTAGRACEYHKLTRAWDLLALAAFIRETVRKSPSSPSGDFSFQAGRDGTPFYSRLCRAVDGALSQ